MNLDNLLTETSVSKLAEGLFPANPTIKAVLLASEKVRVGAQLIEEGRAELLRLIKDKPTVKYPNILLIEKTGQRKKPLKEMTDKTKRLRSQTKTQSAKWLDPTRTDPARTAVLLDETYGCFEGGKQLSVVQITKTTGHWFNPIRRALATLETQGKVKWADKSGKIVSHANKGKWMLV